MRCVWVPESDLSPASQTAASSHSRGAGLSEPAANTAEEHQNTTGAGQSTSTVRFSSPAPAASSAGLCWHSRSSLTPAAALWVASPSPRLLSETLSSSPPAAGAASAEPRLYTAAPCTGITLISKYTGFLQVSWRLIPSKENVWNKLKGT